MCSFKIRYIKFRYQVPGIILVRLAQGNKQDVTTERGDRHHKPAKTWQEIKNHLLIAS